MIFIWVWDDNWWRWQSDYWSCEGGEGRGGWILCGTFRLRSARSRERLLLSLAFSRALRSGGWSISDLAFLSWAAAWAMAVLSLFPPWTGPKLCDHFWKSSQESLPVSPIKKKPHLIRCLSLSLEDEDRTRTERPLVSLVLQHTETESVCCSLSLCCLGYCIWDMAGKGGGGSRMHHQEVKRRANREARRRQRGRESSTPSLWTQTPEVAADAMETWRDSDWN